MAEVFLKSLVGRFTYITGGGTRNEIKLSRPWQPSLPIAPEKCPFCTKPQEEISLPAVPDWRLLPNPYTPHRRHRLAIPRLCWDGETLQNLGGLAGIYSALQAVSCAIEQDKQPMGAFIHVGINAGQNLGHAHWHIMEVRKRGIFETFETEYVDPKLLVCRMGDFNIFTAGGGMSHYIRK